MRCWPGQCGCTPGAGNRQSRSSGATSAVHLYRGRGLDPFGVAEPSDDSLLPAQLVADANSRTAERKVRLLVEGASSDDFMSKDEIVANQEMETVLQIKSLLNRLGKSQRRRIVPW